MQQPMGAPAHLDETSPKDNHNNDTDYAHPQETGVMQSAATMMHPGVNGEATMMYAPLMGQHHPSLGIGLEQQFAQFGLHPGSDPTSLADSGRDSSENNTEAYEGEESDEEPLKLFVGQVRRECLPGVNSSVNSSANCLPLRLASTLILIHYICSLSLSRFQKH